MNCVLNYATVTGQLADDPVRGTDKKTGRPCIKVELVQHQGDEVAALWYITAVNPAPMRFLERARRGDWIAASGPFVAAFVAIGEADFAPCFDIEADLLAEAPRGRCRYQD